MHCVAHDDDQPCTREAAMTAPVALCRTHQLQVALAVVPALLRDELGGSPQSVPIADLLAGSHDSVVYFILNGNRIKIGTTTNLRGRVGALSLRLDAVVLVLRGGAQLEARLHERFSTHRIDDTEWFELSAEIRSYLAEAADFRVARTTQHQPAVRVQTPQSPRIANALANPAEFLGDVAEVIGEARRTRTQAVLVGLAELKPDAYRGWGFTDLTQALNAAGAPPHKYNGYAVIASQTILAAVDRHVTE